MFTMNYSLHLHQLHATYCLFTPFSWMSECRLKKKSWMKSSSEVFPNAAHKLRLKSFGEIVVLFMEQLYALRSQCRNSNCDVPEIKSAPLNDFTSPISNSWCYLWVSCKNIWFVVFYSKSSFPALVSYLSLFIKLVFFLILVGISFCIKLSHNHSERISLVGFPQT